MKKAVTTENSVHVTTVEVFVSVSILFVAPYTPVTLSTLTANNHIIYKILYMINHVGNPIIYYALNKKFREDVNALGEKWLQKIKSFSGF